MNINVKESWDIDKTDVVDGNMNAGDAISNRSVGAYQYPSYNLTTVYCHRNTPINRRVKADIDVDIVIFYSYCYWYCTIFIIESMNWEN